MTGPTIFNTPLCVTQLDERRWRTISVLVYESAVAGEPVIVPPRFITDFASVPRTMVMWWIAGGVGNLAATVHDWLYQTHALGSEAPKEPGTPVTKALADAIFYEALRYHGIAAWRAWTMRQAVAAFGEGPWRTGPSRFATLNPIWHAERVKTADIMEA